MIIKHLFTYYSYNCYQGLQLINFMIGVNPSKPYLNIKQSQMQKSYDITLENMHTELLPNPDGPLLRMSLGKPFSDWLT